MTALPSVGYHFTSWSDGVLTAARTDTSVTEDITVTANFALNSYTLTYSAGAGGSISGASPQTVNHGSDGTLVTALPGVGYHFTNWSDGILTAARTDTNVTDDITVTANFAIDTFTLTYAAGDHGSITGDTSQTVDYGGDGTQVTAVPATGYHFVEWSDLSTDNPRTDLNVTDDISVTASFAINTYTLTVNSDHGTVTPDVLPPYHYGDTVHLDVTAATGWTFTNWSGDASGTDDPLTVVMNANKTVTANYSQNVYTLTVNSDHGTVTPDVLPPYHYGDTVHLDVAADPGWTFTNWSGDAGGTDDPLTVVMDADKTITANYTAAGPVFADLPVPGKEWMEPWMVAFYNAGITTGCGTSPLRYCPENPVTRAAMAVFVLRAIEGPAYVPPPASSLSSPICPWPARSGWNRG